MLDSGVRLRLLVGATVPSPAPFALADALTDLEVRLYDRQRGVFQMTFAIAKGAPGEYRLLRDGLMDPPARVHLSVALGGRGEALIDGVVTEHQVAPSNEPGQARLVVTGEDLSRSMDLEERNRTFANQSDSAIVEGVVREHGMRPDVTATDEVPAETQRLTTQQGTDLEIVEDLAARNGFVFFVEATEVPGAPLAYWGPERRDGPVQPALSVDMGPATNVSWLRFGFSAIAGAAPQLAILDPLTKQVVGIPVPDPRQPPLSSRPASNLRTSQVREAANLDPLQAALRALATSNQSADPASGSGELVVSRYGRLLHCRQRVDVRGAGSGQDGTYSVSAVTHVIRRGEYRQRFTLKREGRGATSGLVTV
jgi:phage protein D